MKPCNVYVPSFDPDDCEFTAAQWCEEIGHHRIHNTWTDYKIRDAEFIHLRDRGYKRASKFYPLYKTWNEAKERTSWQFTSTKRFHFFSRIWCSIRATRIAPPHCTSTSYTPLVSLLWWRFGDCMEWSCYAAEAGISDTQVWSVFFFNIPMEFVALDRHLGTYFKIENQQRPASLHAIFKEPKRRKLDSGENNVCHNCGQTGH